MRKKSGRFWNTLLAVLLATGLSCSIDSHGAVITGGDQPVSTQDATGTPGVAKPKETTKSAGKKKPKAAKEQKKKVVVAPAETVASPATAPGVSSEPTDKREAGSASPAGPQTAPQQVQISPPSAPQAAQARPETPRPPSVLPEKTSVVAMPQGPKSLDPSRGQSAPSMQVTSPKSPYPAEAPPKPIIPTATKPSEASRPSVVATPVAPSAGPRHAKETKYVTIDFDNVDIQVFARFISEMTGKNFVFDEKVRGKVTILSPRKITTDEAYKVFESVLDVNGFSAVPAGDVIKIVPAHQAKEKMLETRLDFEKISPEDKMVTQIIPLYHASSDEMKKVLDPLVPKTSVIISYPPTGTLIVTDLLSNIKKLQTIIEAIDQEGVGEQISYIPLKNAVATDVVKALTAVFQQQKGISQLKFVAYDRTNAVIVKATEIDIQRVKDLIGMLDQAAIKETANLHVYKLQNAWAEDLAKVLMNLPTKSTTGTQPQAGGAPVLSKNIQIVADKATNTLIITADRADYTVLESVIKQLDMNRPMVYIEALIMEVSVTKGFRLGVEWQSMASFSYDTSKGGVSKTGAIGGGFSGDTYSNISGLFPTTTGALPTLPLGMSLGVVGQGITVSMGGTTLTFPNFAALIQAYQSNSDISVLATPQLLTMNNEEAEINISKNVPYITRQDQTNIGTTGTNYSNYEYKDVGIIIKITPHINEDGFIRLKIDQNVSSIDTTSDAYRPTTRKRSAKTTVILKDGNTLVIGGLIQENTDRGTFKVPLLGDIPILGWLFKYQRKTTDKTNLFFFISPKIVRTVAEAAALTTQKQSEIGVLEEGTIRMYDPKKDKPKASAP